jgi:hypothetical protein
MHISCVVINCINSGNTSFDLLVGYFNAKTAVLEDFSEPDESFLNVMDVNVEDDLFRYCYDYQVLLANNMSLKRYTQCECRPNNFGRKLLEMCKSALAIFEKYCHYWELKVNLQKTKVIIFCKRKSKNQPIFKLCGENLQIRIQLSFFSFEISLFQKFTILNFIHNT